MKVFVLNPQNSDQCDSGVYRISQTGNANPKAGDADLIFCQIFLKNLPESVRKWTKWERRANDSRHV